MQIEFSVNAPMLIQFCVAVLLPVAVGLVTTRVTSPGRKAVLLLVLSTVTALLTELLASIRADQPYDLGVGLMTALTTFIIGVAMHYGLWKPTGVTAAVKDTGITSS